MCHTELSCKFKRHSNTERQIIPHFRIFERGWKLGCQVWCYNFRVKTIYSQLQNWIEIRNRVRFIFFFFESLLKLITAIGFRFDSKGKRNHISIEISHQFQMKFKYTIDFIVMYFCMCGRERGGQRDREWRRFCMFCQSTTRSQEQPLVTSQNIVEKSYEKS